MTVYLRGNLASNQLKDLHGSATGWQRGRGIYKTCTMLLKYFIQLLGVCVCILYGMRYFVAYTKNNTGVYSNTLV